MDKEMLDIVFAYNKVCLYLIRSKSIVFANHSTIKYLVENVKKKKKVLRREDGVQATIN